VHARYDPHVVPAPDDIKAEAIAMLKSGRTPADVYAHVVGRGVDATTAKATVDELIALKRQADAQDPQRMRQEAKWMFVNATPVADVVAYFTSNGVPETYAAEEAERILAVVRTMRPCQGCGAPSESAELTMDAYGRTMCRGCVARGQIVLANNRATVSRLGTTPLVADVITSMQDTAHETRPPCRWCVAYATLHISQLRQDARLNYPIVTKWVCGRCWRVVD
jgi:hypothetical protein